LSDNPEFEEFVQGVNAGAARAQAAIEVEIAFQVAGGVVGRLAGIALSAVIGATLRTGSEVVAEVVAEAVPTASRAGGTAAVRVGQAGEAAVRSVADIGPKVAIDVAGRTRIPDGLTRTVLSEVKNVSSLSYTQQLRDFAAHASANGLRFDLWVRPTTRLSGPLAQEVANGAINLRYIP
jgi:hypothetical protein